MYMRTYTKLQLFAITGRGRREREYPLEMEKKRLLSAAIEKK